VDPVDEIVIDEVLLMFMASPKSYTREDVVEIHCHGGYMVLRGILECVLREGVRLAEPGEFTKRAFLNGRIDLAQAEAVIEMIKAKTPGGLRVANEQLRGRLSAEIDGIKEVLVETLAEIEGCLDFPDEETAEIMPEGVGEKLGEVSKGLKKLISSFHDGKVLRDGVAVAIVGRTNAGKSSLLNALLREERAIVTAIAGTTRDVLEETVSLGGLKLKVVDTAGIRRWRNAAEQEGIRRTKRAIKEADLILVVVDRSRRLGPEDERIFKLIRRKKNIVILNKIDLCEKVGRKRIAEVFGEKTAIVEISARTGDGVECVKERIYEVVAAGGVDGVGERTVILEARHKSGLGEALEAMERGKRVARGEGSLEIVAFEIRSALGKLGEILGETVSEDVLDRIFNRFCIGK
jgi:tRNA modification GTPase